MFDDDGDLYIVDRKKDMVLVSGFNVYPREIEDVLRRHPNVGDVAVIGVPDEHTGEHIKAIVVADPPGESVTSESLLEFCSKNLAPYKTPKEIEIVAEIPRNAAGKVLRRELRRQLTVVVLPIAAAIVAFWFALATWRAASDRNVALRVWSVALAQFGVGVPRARVGDRVRVDAARLPRLLPLRCGAQRRVARARDDLAARASTVRAHVQRGHSPRGPGSARPS